MRAVHDAVSLRDVVADDLPTFFVQQADPESTAMAAFMPRDWEAFQVHWQRVLQNERSAKRTVLWGPNIAGNIVAFEQSAQWLVGYWIGREFWGKGIATEALRLFLDEFPARPLHAHVATHNLGSIRVLEKCGFNAYETTPPGADGIAEIRLVRSD